MVKRAASTKQKDLSPQPLVTSKTSSKKRKTISKAIPTTDDKKVMFGKSKKNRQSSSTSNSSAYGLNHDNIKDMFTSIAEDSNDPNTVINMEGK